MFLHLCIFVTALLIAQYLKKFFHFRGRGFPYITPLPFGGLESIFQRNDLVSLERRKIYGSVYGHFRGAFPCIMVSDPEIVKEITIKEGHNFSDSHPIKLNIPYFKEIFILKKGQAWKEGRAIVSPVFTTRKIKDIFTQFRKASKSLFRNIENLIKEGKQDDVDIKVILKNYGIDVVGKFVYAIDIDSTQNKDHPFVKAVLNFVDFNTLRSYLLFITNLLPRPLKKFTEFNIVDPEAVEFLANLTRSLIKQRTENKNENYNDFLDLLLKSFAEKNVVVPESEVIGLCMLFFFAAIDTVSLSICNALYCLALNPEYQRKLYKELIKVYPDKQTNYENIKNCAFLEAILKESQRMFPAFDKVFRIAERPIEIKGIKFQTDDIVGIDIYAMHNTPDYWENPEKFYPERFLEKDIKFETDDIFKPFGSGIRSCIAPRFALMNVRFILGQVILNYEVYRSEKTNVPLKYMVHPQQLLYKNLVLGFRKRES